MALLSLECCIAMTLMTNWWGSGPCLHPLSHFNSSRDSWSGNWLVVHLIGAEVMYIK